MNLFRRSTSQPTPQVDDASRQLAALRSALERTKSELATIQRSRDEAVRSIGELRAQAAICDGEERAELLERAELETREKLLLAEIEMSTTKQAIELLGEQVTNAENALTVATVSADRDRLHAMLDRYQSLSSLLEEDVTAKVLPRIEELGRLSSRIEPALDKLRSQARPLGIDTPRFDRRPVVSDLSQRILKSWNSGVEHHEHREAVEQAHDAPPVTLPESPGETVMSDGHAWTFALLQEGESGGPCTREHCGQPAVARLTYTAPPPAQPRASLGCQQHLNEFRYRFFRQPAVVSR